MSSAPPRLPHPRPASPLQAIFDAAPGRLLIQMTIENAVAQVLDVDVRDVSVSALNTQVGLGTPQVWRARNAREFRAIDEHPEAAPSATREFSRTERLLVRVPAFGTEAPQVSARLLSRQGTPIREIPLTTEEDGTTRRLDLPLAGFAVGDYAIEFLARGRVATSARLSASASGPDTAARASDRAVAFAR